VNRRLRAGRRTNLALLVLLASAVLTGALAFANGGRWAFAALAAHGAVGSGIVLLSPWKTTISRRGMRRSADALKRPTYVEDKDSGELRRPHHVDLKTGMYKGRQVLKAKTEA